MADIVDTGDLSEEPQSHLVASEESKPNERIEFHVQMRGWTASEMDELIVEAAARLIVGKRGDRDYAKEIEARCQELVTAKIDGHLSGVTDAIIDQPLTPAFAGSAKEPVTMRELIGLYGREYLTQKVDRHTGKPETAGYRDGMPRIEYLVRRHMDSKFEGELTRAVNATVSEIQANVRARLDAVLIAEKARMRDALDKLANPQ